MIDPNWLLILRSAYSARLMLASAASSVVVAIQTENNYAILAAILSLLGMVCRVVVQPVLRAQLDQNGECVNRIQ
jgi:hypothetical protein